MQCETGTKAESFEVYQELTRPLLRRWQVEPVGRENFTKYWLFLPQLSHLLPETATKPQIFAGDGADAASFVSALIQNHTMMRNLSVVDCLQTNLYVSIDTGEPEFADAAWKAKRPFLCGTVLEILESVNQFLATRLVYDWEDYFSIKIWSTSSFFAGPRKPTQFSPGLFPDVIWEGWFTAGYLAQELWQAFPGWNAHSPLFCVNSSEPLAGTMNEQKLVMTTASLHNALFELLAQQFSKLSQDEVKLTKCAINCITQGNETQNLPQKSKLVFRQIFKGGGEDFSKISAAISALVDRVFQKLQTEHTFVVQCDFHETRLGSRWFRRGGVPVLVCTITRFL